MLITTSRKPSSKTRAFCKNLSHALGTDYINRGKMSMRELQLKSTDIGSKTIALINEMKGNPSKITFFNNNGEELLVIIGSLSTTNKRLHIKTVELTFTSDIPELIILKDILIVNNPHNSYNSFDSSNLSNFDDLNNFNESNIGFDDIMKNHIHVEKIDDNFDNEIEDSNKKIGIIHFYNRDGKDTGLKINIRRIIN